MHYVLAATLADLFSAAEKRSRRGMTSRPEYQLQDCRQVVV